MSDPRDERDKTEVAPRDFLEGFLGPETSSVNGEEGQALSDQAPSTDGSGPLRLRIIEQLRSIYDPEIPVNIYDLGLIYAVDVDDDDRAVVTMTLTTPHCPVAEIMPDEVQTRVRQVEGVAEAVVNLVWDPPWDPSRMTEAAQLELGFL